MKHFRFLALAAAMTTGVVMGILPGCVEDTILRMVTPFLFS